MFHFLPEAIASYVQKVDSCMESMEGDHYVGLKNIFITAISISTSTTT